MMLHQDASPHAWFEGHARLDPVIILDDATSAASSAALMEEVAMQSSYLGLASTFGGHGPQSSLYTVRGSHYLHSSEAGAR
jgi:hypothetical protein